MIWILLCIGLLLIILNIKAINKEKNSFDFVLNNTEEDMKEFNYKLTELRKEFSETILELQKEIEILKGTYIKDINEMDNIIFEDTKEDSKNNEEDNKHISEQEESLQHGAIKESSKTPKNKRDKKIAQTPKDNTTTNNNVKIEEINRLLTEGLSIEEISEKLGIGKGEVLLIKELYLR